MASQRNVSNPRRGSTKRASRAPAAEASKGDRSAATIALRPAKDWTPEEKQAVIRWLCHEKFDDLFRQALGILGDSDSARDVTQGFLVGLLSSKCELMHFTPDIAQLWPTYIKTCMKNFALKELERRSKERARTVPLDEVDRIGSVHHERGSLDDRFAVGESVSPRGLYAAERSFEHKRALEYLRACLEQLKPMYQQAFYFVEIEGVRPADLEVRLGATAERWRQRLLRAREQMRSCLTERYRLAAASMKSRILR